MASKGPTKSAPKANAGKQRASAPAARAVSPKPAAPAVPATEKAAVETPVQTPVRKAVDQVVETSAATVRKASDEAKTVVAKTAAVAAKAAAPVKAAVETAAKTVQTRANKDHSIMTSIEETMTKTQAMFGDVNERAKAQFEKNAKAVEELNAFAKGNVEALVESGKIAAKGFETIGQDSAEFTRKSFEKATATMKELSAVKSPADFFKLQSDFVRETFDSIIAVTSKNTEAMMKLAGDAAQPVSSRYAVAVEKAKTAA